MSLLPLTTSDLGTSVYLKNKYAGYTVEIVVRPAYQAEMVGTVEKMIPGKLPTGGPLPVDLCRGIMCVGERE